MHTIERFEIIAIQQTAYISWIDAINQETNIYAMFPEYQIPRKLCEVGAIFCIKRRCGPSRDHFDMAWAPETA